MNNRLLSAHECQATDRVPFLPAIYEHKAWFVNSTPSSVCRDVNLFTNALIAEYERVQPDALTIGIDVYNVEAEAIGCKITYYDGDDASIPSIRSEDAVFRGREDITEKKIPNPMKDGRMPLHLEVAHNVVRVLGREVPIRGAVSGPFSLAAHLAGLEHLLMSTVMHQQLAQDLIKFATAVIKEYGEAYIHAGCGVVIFDSQASSTMISPEIYREFVLPATKFLIDHFHACGVRHVPLIIGGKTTPMLDAYLETGANNILCDTPSDVQQFREACLKQKRAFRRNIDSREFLEASPEVLHQLAVERLKERQGYNGFILGTSVVPYGTPLENLKAIRDAVIEFKV
ncbi:MAG: uroporphyrinogen decarboxylase family protein [bacterium]